MIKYIKQSLIPEETEDTHKELCVEFKDLDSQANKIAQIMTWEFSLEKRRSLVASPTNLNGGLGTQ